MVVENRSFQVGDRVKWSSQSAGRVVEKTGAVVEVVAAGALPEQHIRGGGGQPRRHESYVVRAKKRDGQKSNYWPLVKNLRPWLLPAQPAVSTKPLDGSGIHFI